MTTVESSRGARNENLYLEWETQPLHFFGPNGTAVARSLEWLSEMTKEDAERFYFDRVSIPHGALLPINTAILSSEYAYAWENAWKIFSRDLGTQNGIGGVYLGVVGECVINATIGAPFMSWRTHAEAFNLFPDKVRQEVQRGMRLFPNTA